MKTLVHLFTFVLLVSTPVDAVPLPEQVGGKDLKRDDPKVAEALRTLPTMAGPTVEAFEEALHAEEVVRDLDRAAAKYEAILGNYHKRGDGWGAQAAALAKFRIAEIRRKQGKKEEARKHYEELIREFADWEPMVSLSRQQLGLDPSDFFPETSKIEDDHQLTERIKRTSWKLRSRVCDDAFVLVTFQVEPDEEEPYEGMPEGYEIKTLHYKPGGALTGFVSATSIKGDVVKKGKFFGDPILGTRSTLVTGFGHSFRVPAGLRQFMAVSMAETGWIGKRGLNFDNRVALVFHDEMDEKSKKLSVRFTLATISEAKARELVEDRSISLPEMKGSGWSITLPPAISEIKDQQVGK